MRDRCVWSVAQAHTNVCRPDESRACFVWVTMHFPWGETVLDEEMDFVESHHVWIWSNNKFLVEACYSSIHVQDSYHVANSELVAVQGTSSSTCTPRQMPCFQVNIFRRAWALSSSRIDNACSKSKARTHRVIQQKRWSSPCGLLWSSLGLPWLQFESLDLCKSVPSLVKLKVGPEISSQIPNDCIWNI